MPQLALPSARVHYTAHGEGAPLVLLHANPGDSRDFEAVIPALACTHRVLALDWPGYGASDLPADPGAAHVMFFHQVLREFLNALALPSALLIGNSVGGNVAVRLAAESPGRVRGLVLVAPGGFTPHNAFTRAFCALQGSQLSLSPALFARMYLRRRTPTTEAMLERAATMQAQDGSKTLNRALWRSFGRSENDLRAMALKIHCPVLLLFGERDPAIPARRDGRVAAACLSSARMVTLPCGHAPFAEMPQLFLEHVQPFVAACRQA